METEPDSPSRQPGQIQGGLRGKVLGTETCAAGRGVSNRGLESCHSGFQGGWEKVVDEGRTGDETPNSTLRLGEGAGGALGRLSQDLSGLREGTDLGGLGTTETLSGLGLGLGLGEGSGQRTSELLGAGQASKLSGRLRESLQFFFKLL